MCAHTSLHICTPMSICLFPLETMSLQWFLQLRSTIPWSTLAFHLFISVPFLSCLLVTNRAPLSSVYFTYLFNPLVCKQCPRHITHLLGQCHRLRPACFGCKFLSGPSGAAWTPSLPNLFCYKCAFRRFFLFFFNRPGEFESNLCSCWLRSLSFIDR